MSLRFDPATRARYRKALLRKGKQIADELAALLAGKDRKPRTHELPSAAQKPGIRPEEALRVYLDHVDGCRGLLDAEDDRFGRCGLCGIDLGPVALEQMPWADRCQSCAPELG